MPKAIEFTIIDPNTSKRHKACYDSNIITGVQEYRFEGGMRAQILIAGIQGLLLDEDYASFRSRWLEARDGLEVVPLGLPAPKLHTVS